MHVSEKLSKSEIDSLELHDGLILELTVNFQQKTLSLFVECYLKENAPSRSLIKIIFMQVSDLSSMFCLDRIESNKFAGNINYWIPSLTKERTFIYLTDGCLSIEAQELMVEMVKPA